MVQVQVRTSMSQGMSAYWSLVKVMKTARTTSCVPVRVLVSDIRSCSELRFGSTSGLPGLIILCESDYPGIQFRRAQASRGHWAKGLRLLSRVTYVTPCYNWCSYCHGSTQSPRPMTCMTIRIRLGHPCINNVGVSTLNLLRDRSTCTI
jgi:hypothetical protein